MTGSLLFDLGLVLGELQCTSRVDGNTVSTKLKNKYNDR